SSMQRIDWRVRIALAILSGAFISAAATEQPPASLPHLERQGNATRLIVDGKPFLALAGELGNNTASSLENMVPLWDRLVSGNLNCVLAAVSWAQVEPVEGRFEFKLVDGLIDEARAHNLRLVFLWFGSWKNGLSSYAPYWVKADYKRFPRIRLGNGRSMEILSTFGEASREADARAFAALMRHIREVDGQHRTVIMMQVENEVGVLRDSRDRSPEAEHAFAGAVPAQLMDYLVKHRDTLAPELRDAWAAHGSRESGTWEQVFGPGKPSDVAMPIHTTTPPLSAEEREAAWHKMTWASDEAFMAWNYARYIGSVIRAGKAEYNLPMFVNGWLQQPNTAWPGTFPSGGPLPQVHDVWRAGGAADIFSPDIYIPQFDETCARFTRNGNPLFIPETGVNPLNVFVAFARFGAIGYSPFFIERSVGPDTGLAAAYRAIENLAPAISARQGSDGIAAVRMKTGDDPLVLHLGGYTFELRFVGHGRVPISPEPATERQAAGTPGQGAPVEGSAILAAGEPNEFFMGAIGGAFRVSITPGTPGPSTAGLGDIQEGRFVDGKWTVLRQLGGDDTGQGEILSIRANQTLRLTLYRYE
ncbi:MAG: DUF5597 domain-containing protein, partial [Acidobacteriota bacterium]|nr:DUF5597 domain-containing protein [Acidobacteriota bacterium]